MGSCFKRLAVTGALVVVGVLINGSTALALCPIDSPCCPGGCPSPKDGTHTSVVSSGSPSQYGQSVTFTATVTDTTDSTVTPSGTVTFKEGTVTLGTGTLSGGQASFTTSTLSVASHSIMASYAGNTAFLGSSSSTSQTVNQDPTSTSLTSSKNPSSVGDAVTFTATVSAAHDSPGGAVTFKDGSTSLGSAAVSGGHAVLTTSALGAGSHPITATYSSDPNNLASSANLSQTVNQDASSVTLTSSKNPSSVGDLVTFTATVASGGPDAPTGSVTFMDGSTNLATVPISGGHAVLATSTLGAGSHSITATYGGDANNATSTTALSQTVNPAPAGSGGSGGGLVSGGASSAGAGSSGSGGSGGNHAVTQLPTRKGAGLKCVKPARKHHGKAKPKRCTTTTHKKHRARRKH